MKCKIFHTGEEDGEECYVEVETIHDLIAICKKEGHDLVFQLCENDVVKLEIYDYWRE